jgi:hypothetical protein
VLRVEFSLEDGGGSGIALRAFPGEKLPFRNGQIFDHPIMKLLQTPGHGRESEQTGTTRWLLAGTEVVQLERMATLEPAGSWNRLEIEVRRRAMRASVNGNQVINTTYSGGALLPGSVVPGLERTNGRIGLQKHTKTVRFRNIEIKELPRQ